MALSCSEGGIAVNRNGSLLGVCGTKDPEKALFVIVKRVWARLKERGYEKPLHQV